MEINNEELEVTISKKNYVIQTNTILNEDGTPRDFTSFMFQLQNQTWEEFKEYILNNDTKETKQIKGTLDGASKPNDCIISEEIINTDQQLEVMIFFGADYDRRVNAKFFLVTEEEFKKIL
ncbi:hypothetical protein [Clostridium tagluense]|uniref:Uncharacterized protein n=1 Tax=Clostridium tagluense TaxID=360422 RepID=A0A401UTM1_9CLOT|nr:hypothetical protein [Clostridium tagluense]GCD12893.1 hypothetical protein Ctaglu_45160 [Clostridium tagluense]